MTSQDIDTLARSHKPLPPEALMSDKMLYHILSALYAEYREGVISAEYARKEKSDAISQHDQYQLWERIFRDHAQRMVQISAELSQPRCEDCKIAKIFDGRLNV